MGQAAPRRQRVWVPVSGVCAGQMAQNGDGKIDQEVVGPAARRFGQDLLMARSEKKKASPPEEPRLTPADLKRLVETELEETPGRGTGAGPAVVPEAVRPELDAWLERVRRHISTGE